MYASTVTTKERRARTELPTIHKTSATNNRTLNASSATKDIRISPSVKVKITGTVSTMEIKVAAGSTYFPRSCATLIEHQATSREHNRSYGRSCRTKICSPYASSSANPRAMKTSHSTLVTCHTL